MFFIEYDKNKFIDADKMTGISPYDDELFFTVVGSDKLIRIDVQYRDTFLNNLQSRNEGVINVESKLKKQEN